MEILLNDQPLDFTLEGERTLGEVVHGLERWLEGSALVLYSVRHGGRELLGLPAEQWAGTPQSEVGRLEVSVKDARELAEELEPCLERAADVSLLLQTGRDREAMELIVRFTELSQALLRALESADLPAVDGREPREFFEELNRMLKELAQAFEARDTVLIGDLMEYEIAPRLRKLQAVLP